MLTCHLTLSGGACFVCVESTERGTIALLYQGEPQLPTAESSARDESDIAAPLKIPGRWLK